MKQAKKMMLVDFDQGIDLRNTKRQYSLLDQNISDVLNQQIVEDHEKAQIYQTALNKFLINRQSSKN